MFPVSQVPSSAVAVCVAPSPFVHWTVSPTLTVTESGANANPAIFTACCAAIATGAIARTSVNATAPATGAPRPANRTSVPISQPPHALDTGAYAAGRHAD